MGKQRARSQEELNQRYEDILTAASKLFMENNYEDLSLTNIAKSLGLSRPALYSYFQSKEALFLELSKKEYLAITQELSKKFTHEIGVKEFCVQLMEIFLSRPLFVKLLALHQSVMETKVGFEHMKEFKTATVPFFRRMFAICRQEFPNANETEIAQFIAQINVLLPTVNAYHTIPVEQVQVMEELKIFGDKPLKTTLDFYSETLEQLAQKLV